MTWTTKQQFEFESKEILKKCRAKGILKIDEANQFMLHQDEVVNFKKEAEHRNVAPAHYNILGSVNWKQISNKQDDLGGGGHFV